MKPCNFIGFVAQGIDEDFKLHTIFIAFEPVKGEILFIFINSLILSINHAVHVGRHTNETIKSMVYDEVISKFQANKVFKLVTDQGSNM